MYVQGFVDISGGNLILRNNNLYMTSGDLSLNGRLLVNSDVSMNGNISSITLNIINNSATKWAVQNALPINGAWSSTSVSITGQYMLATQNTGNVYLSSTYGNSWAVIPDLPTSGAWTSVVMSSDSRYMLATTNGAGVYASAAYGVSGSWLQIKTTILPTAGNYMNSAMSSNGQYMMVANNTSGSVYISTAYGASGSWGPVSYANTSAGLPTNSAWAGLAMSGTGQYMLAAQNTGNVYLSYTYGQAWMTIPAATLPSTGAWQNLSISTTGQYMLAANNSAGSVYLSTNFGTTWTAVSSSYLPTNGNWYAVNVSSTGQYMLAANNSAGSTYYSSNYGTTWAAITALPTSSSWRSLSISSTGLYMLVSVNGGAVYTSSVSNVTNIIGNVGVNNSVPQYAFDVSGQINASQGLVTTGITGSSTTAFQQNWGPITSLPTNGNWNNGTISMSSTGQYMLVGNNTSGSVYLSTNYGAAWSSITVTLPTNVSWRGISVSSTGQYMLACVSTAASNVYLSSNYGTTWATVTALSTASWITVSTSSTGQYMLAGINSGLVYLNNNYGVGAWTSLGSLLPTNGIWTSSAISSTGQYMLLGNNNTSGFYLSNNYGTTWSLLSNGLLTSSTPWQCSMSSTGQYMIALYNISSVNALAFITNNFGESWAPIPLVAIYWSTSCISSTGQYIFLTGGASSNCWYSTNYGTSWSLVTAMTVYTGATISSSAMSSNGQYILAGVNGSGPIYLSSGIPITTMGVNNPNPQYAVDVSGTVNLSNALTTGMPNYGAASTWSTITSIGTINACGSVSMSSTGQYMLIPTYNSNGVYLSQNFGVTWAQVSGLTTNVTFNCTAMSSTGQYMLASLGGSTSTVYLSTNYGSSWTAISSTYLPSSNSYLALSISSTGQYMAVGRGDACTMYLNSNYGSGSWTSTTSAFPTGVGFISIAISSSGQYLMACLNSIIGGVYLSTNYGVSWASSSLPTLNTWWNVGMSSTGQYMIATGTATVSISSNYGINWISASIPSFTINSSCCVSSTGQYMFVYTGNGSYFSSTYGSTWNTITNVLPTTAIGTNVRFSAISGNGQYILTTINGYYPYLSSGSQSSTTITGPLTVAGNLYSTLPYIVLGSAAGNQTGVSYLATWSFNQGTAAMYNSSDTSKIFAPIKGFYTFTFNGHMYTSSTTLNIYYPCFKIAQYTSGGTQYSPAGKSTASYQVGTAIPPQTGNNDTYFTGTLSIMMNVGDYITVTYATANGQSVNWNYGNNWGWMYGNCTFALT
jgi:hypothetical protein